MPQISRDLLPHDTEDLERLLVTDGLRLVDQGLAQAVLDALRRLDPARAACRSLALVRGAALLVTGASDEAVACLEPLMDGTAAVAWRLGTVHYLLGDPDAALAAYTRSSVDDPEPVEQARLASWSSAAHWAKGDAEASGRDAARALELARSTGDAGALGAAYAALGLHAALVGDRCANATYLERALEFASRAGDLVQTARILANRASKLTEEGRHAAALVEADAALEAARASGFTVVLALSAVNRGLALLRLGHLDDAIHAFCEARDAYQRIGSRRVADALCGLGDVHRERGDLALARASYEEALGVLGDSGDCQARVPVLAGLARVVWHEDHARACALADEAVACPGSLDHAFAVATVGWLHLLSGDVERAKLLARRAVELAGRRRSTRSLADALELTALATPDHAVRLTLLDEAASARSADGDVVGEARVRLASIRSSAGAAARRRAAFATDVLARLGVRTDGPPGLGVLASFAPAAPSTAVQCLGRFEVRRRGEPVPATAWQSRKARDLLKLLAARRGRAVAREQLMDELWPGVDPVELGNRLAVAVATVRRVLDPGRAHSVDHFVAGEDGALSLNLNHVELDVDAFLDHVTEARHAIAAGRLDEARTLLDVAVACYRGDAFEEEPYAEWASSLREEARNAYAEALHRLLSMCRDGGDDEGALVVARRLLALDPYDEAGHRSCVELLTARGQHGEAERARTVYASRMCELGLAPAP